MAGCILRTRPLALRNYTRQTVGAKWNRQPPPRLFLWQLQEAIMSHWHDTMVDRPETDGAVYATGWTISGLAVLGAIVAVWVLGI